MHRMSGPPIHEQTLGSADAMLLRLLDGDESMGGTKQPYDPRIHFVLIRDAYLDANPGNEELRQWLDTALDQFDDVYELNDTAKRYLVSDGPAGMADLVAVAPGPRENWTRLAETVRLGRPATPIEDDPAAFYVPLVEGTFTTMYRCAMRADLKIRYSAMSAPRVLDLGAGGAPWAIAILSHNKTATAVVNDLPDVIQVAERKVADHGVGDRVEFLPGDFHEIEIAPASYDIVVLGHICRTEGADGARDLINRAYEALRPEGRLILADYFIDVERKFNPHAVLMGTTMMASTLKGSAFTHQQFSEWIRVAGFTSLRLIEPIGFQQQFVAVKPRTAGTQPSSQKE